MLGMSGTTSETRVIKFAMSRTMREAVLSFRSSGNFMTF
jgi:hypothetical protein